jgi:hypothetical protein
MARFDRFSRRNLAIVISLLFHAAPAGRARHNAFKLDHLRQIDFPTKQKRRSPKAVVSKAADAVAVGTERNATMV